MQYATSTNYACNVHVLQSVQIIDTHMQLLGETINCHILSLMPLAVLPFTLGYADR